MRIDRNAATVVGHGNEAICGHLHFDPVGMTTQRLVHGVVDHLGEEVMQRLLVGASDIHARPPAYRLEPLKHFDMFCRIAGIAAGHSADGAASAAAVAPCLWGVGKQVRHF
jgi:hypothetical protein